MEKGFTLIELIITIFILSIAVIGVYGAFSLIVILTSEGADKLQAAYLAQEGAEIVRNIRDTNWLKMDAETQAAGYTSRNWLAGLTDIDCGQTTSGCQADFSNFGNLVPWDDKFLNLDSNGFYGYADNGINTKFKRRIRVFHILDGNGNSLDYAAKVVVEVSWTQKPSLFNSTGTPAGNCGQTNCVKVENILYDWYNYTQAITEPPVIEEQ